MTTAHLPTKVAPPRVASRPGIFYFDAVAFLLAALIGLGRFLVRDSPVTPALFRDVAGFWIPLFALALLFGLRRRAYTQPTPWVAGIYAALTFFASGAIFWRWNVIAFAAATLGGSMLLLAGLVVRPRRTSDTLSRTDVFGLVAVVLSVTLTVTLGEVVLRLGSGFFNEETQQLLRSADPRNFGVPHPYIGHLHTPNNSFVVSGRDFSAVHRVDGLGFRNSWPWPEQADIVTVGDSVTFGLCVENEEAWPSLMGRRMPSSRVINLGLIGAGPQQYHRVFETFGVKLRPKLLLVGVFARNDFGDADVFDRWVASGIGGNYWEWRVFRQSPAFTLSVRHPVESLKRLWNSSVFPVIRKSYIYILMLSLRDMAEWAPPRVYRFPDGRRMLLLENDFINKTSQARPGLREYQLLLGALHHIHALASRNGTRVLILFLPGKEEVYLPLLGESTPDATGPLRKALEQAGIEYLDLAPPFRAGAALGKQLFFEVDGHPNRAGHALIAQLVHERIMQNPERYGLSSDSPRVNPAAARVTARSVQRPARATRSGAAPSGHVRAR